MVKLLELLEAGAHGPKQLLLLGTATTGARFVNNLKPGGRERLVVEHLPLSWRPGACRSWEVDEQVVAHLQVLARARGDRGGRLVVNHPLLGSGLAGLYGRPLAGLLGSGLAGLPEMLLGGRFSGGLGGLLGGDLVGLALDVPGDLPDIGVDILPVSRGRIWIPRREDETGPRSRFNNKKKE